MRSKKEQNSAWSRTKSGVASRIYGGQKQSSKRKGYPMPTYSKNELLEWLMAQELFHVLYDNWKRLDYQTMYKPSVDRVDDYVGYTLANIQLMTWGENQTKYCTDAKDGINTKSSKGVTQYDKDLNVLAEYYSASFAAKQTSVARSNINACCRGTIKSAGGFIWKFTETDNLKNG